MKIAVLGTGNVGRALGTRWAQAGHEVVFGSRNPEDPRVRELAESTECRVLPLAEAAGWGEAMVLAIPWSAIAGLLDAGGPWNGRLMIDCTNALNATFTGLEMGFTTSAAEQIAARAEGARVVKAFNTASAATMWDPRYGEQRATMFYCGDDDEAKQVVAGLAEELGFEPVDAGPLLNARYLEPLAMLYIHLAVRGGWGSHCAFKILKREKPAPLT